MNHAKIRELNDAFRKGHRPELGRIMITAGARHLVAAWPLGEIMLINQARRFEAFTEDNDPWNEHDYGCFDYLGTQVIWKIDLYEKGDVKHRLDRPSRVRRRVDAPPPIAAGLPHCNVTSRWANSSRLVDLMCSRRSTARRSLRKQSSNYAPVPSTTQNITLGLQEPLGAQTCVRPSGGSVGTRLP
jgi:hypothetical protein